MILNKRKLSLISGLFLSILFLYLALRGVDYNAAASALAETNFLFLIFVIPLALFDFTIRSLRWKILLLPIKKCRFYNVISTLFIGFFANAALPLRAGEVIRIVMIGEKEKISKSSATATMVVERTMDLFAVFLLFSISFIFFRPQQTPLIVSRVWKLSGLML